ncbi:MAG TPA: LUD domain-containing protein [Patescibacteria group bacterium]|nr:LUD domain-containing protein [Patescibacteria group bacterium]
MDNKWTQIPTDEVINATIAALDANNIEAFVVENGEDAKKKFFELVPEGSEIFTNTSTTLDTLGITEVLNNSGKYTSIKNKVMELAKSEPENAIHRKQIGSAMPYATGSVHAITADGHLLIASGSGSQLPGYAYGADHIVWIAGAHKLVKDVNEGIKRIYEHSLPLESARMNKVYNTTTGSNPRRILIFNNENDMNKARTKLIIVKEVLGF